MDYRLYNPDGDGNSKLDLCGPDAARGSVCPLQLPLNTVWMDSWYAAKKLMALIEGLGKLYYCPLKTNRLVDDSDGSEPYKRIDELQWNAIEAKCGKLIKICGFPKPKKVSID